MKPEMVLNELSTRESASNLYTARQNMETFVHTFMKAINLGIDRTLRTETHFFNIYLAPDYPIWRWLNDRGVNREIRSRLRTIVTKSPFLYGLPIENYDSYEFRFEENEAIGLGFAYLLEALAVSFPSESTWKTSKLELEEIHIEDDGELYTKDIFVNHASEPEHVSEHDEWIRKRISEEIYDGTILWNRREEFYPNLEFCDRVLQQIRDIPPEDLHWRQVLKKLEELEMYSRENRDCPFCPRKIPSKTTPESQATLQKYGIERTFICPDGTEKNFTWHMRITPGAWRLFFYPDSNRNKIIIGHIGPKLPTVNYPT